MAEIEASFYAALAQLWNDAGQPSMRSMADQCSFSHTTIADYLNGRRMPPWNKATELIKVLGGDPDHYSNTWLRDSANRHPGRSELRDSAAMLDKRRDSDRQVLAMAARIAEDYGRLALREELRKFNSELVREGKPGHLA